MRSVSKWQTAEPLITTRPIPYIQQTSSLLRRSPLELLSTAEIIFTTLFSLVMTFNVPVTKMPSTNVYNELCVKRTLLRSIQKKIVTVCSAVFFRLCIYLMHITPPVTAEGYVGACSIHLF